MAGNVTRSEFWRQQYRSQRYLSGLSEQELKDRFEYILDNTLELSNDNGSGAISPGKVGNNERWWILLTHVFEEAALRSVGLAAAFGNAKHKGFIDKINFKKRYKVFGHPEKSKGLFKFGHYEHLYPMLTDGVVRVCAASYYSKAHYGYSINDDEINKFVNLNEANSDLSALLGGFPIHEFVKYDIKIPIVAPSDYYLFSMSRTFRYRHLFDFGYDAILQIYDEKRFKNSLIRSIEQVLGGDFDFQWRNVDYVDPLRPDNSPFFAVSMKHIRFAYQTEVRFISVPKNPIADLGEPIFLKIGPMHEYAKLDRFDKLT